MSDTNNWPPSFLRPDEKQLGKITYWNESAGFGFIAPEDGGGDIFCHVRDCAGQRAPTVGERVRFLTQPSKRKPGSFAACEVEPVE